MIIANKQKQSGVGLIEILISVILLSIGFLAAAKMQVEGMRNSQSAYYQSQAYFIAADIIDRMRANLPGVRDGHYDDAEISSTVTSPGCDTSTSICSPEQIAQQDLYEWSSHIHVLDQYTGAGVADFIPALPGTVTGTITPVPNSNGVLQVSLTWTEVINNVDSIENLTVNFVAQQTAL